MLPMNIVPENNSLKERIQRLDSAPGEILVMPASISSVVSFDASFITVRDFERGDDLFRDIVISMLDKGTIRRSKLEIAAAIEDVGALISFSSNGLRASVSGKALVKDLPVVLELVKEQLLEPAFPEDEFMRLRERYLASFQQGLLDTGVLSGSALNRSIFPADHPSYSPDPEQEIERLQKISVDDIRSYYLDHISLEDWRMALVGDLDATLLKDSVLMEFPVSDGSGIKPWPTILPEKPLSGQIEINVPDRDNIDVRMGHAIGLRRQDDEYIPLVLGVFILGGNFSARLMQTVRDEKGLTYGIQSGLVGVDPCFSGQWKTSVTLNSDKLQSGMEATLYELKKFVSEGVTEAEIKEKKETIAGSYLVGLSTTGSLARAIVHTRERGEDLDYLDVFPEKVRAVTLQEVNGAITKHLEPDLLHVALAGTLPKIAE